MQTIFLFQLCANNSKRVPIPPEKRHPVKDEILKKNCWYFLKKQHVR